MMIDISGRNTEVRAKTQQYIEKKLKKVAKVAHQVQSIEVRLSENKTTFGISVRVHADKGVFAASAEDENIRSAIDNAITKIERQVADNNDKKEAARREPIPDAPQPSDEVDDEEKYPEEADN